jgi:hypothetical protein
MKIALATVLPVFLIGASPGRSAGSRCSGRLAGPERSGRTVGLYEPIRLGLDPLRNAIHG